MHDPTDERDRTGLRTLDEHFSWRQVYAALECCSEYSCSCTGGVC